MADTDENRRSLVIFGKDVSKIPCFRNTFLYSIEGGIAVGLIAFMFTSKPQMSYHIGVASISLIGLPYWFHCRYNYSKKKFEMARLKAGLQQHIMYEGTPKEKEMLSEQTKDN